MQSQVGQLLCEIIRQSVPPDVADVALLLSGGVDSLSLGFAAQRLGLRVHAYTFQVGEWASSDSRAAESAAKIIGWPFMLVKVPVDSLEADFIELGRKWNCQKKTQYECTWPFLYLTPAIHERYVLSGIAADGHFGLSKKAIFNFRYPKARFDQFRRDYFSSPNPAGQIQQKAVLESHGKVQVAPYLDRRLFDYFIQFDWDTLNKPRQKMPTLAAFPDEFRRIAPRRHANLQLVAGVDHLFEGLLKSNLNTKGRKRFMDLCRDYAKK